MSSKKEQKFEISDSHREFLDMDTDEEDFGRRESPEIEEEVPLEPEKPVYTEEELITLVTHIKDLTVHTVYEKSSWNEECDEIIREYFTNPSHTVLSVYSKEDKLKAVLNIPTCSSNGFTYFVRNQWQIYTPENFRNTILFGTVNKDVKRTVLKYMENIYAPFVLHSDEYASFLRNDVFVNLHKFIMQLMEEIYKPIGLTMLYVPKEPLLEKCSISWNRNDYLLLGRNETTIFSEEDERKRRFIYRLDKVACFWIKQIREATKIPKRGEINNTQDEVNYAYAKHSNLKYLHDQLRNSEVRSIIDILNNFNTISASKLDKLIVNIDKGLKETSSNIKYLKFIHYSCRDLNISQNTEETITEALLSIFFTWKESLFYSITNNLKILLQTFGSQFMQKCIDYIQLDVIFKNKPEEGIRILEKCIFYCNVYETVYDNLTTNVLPLVNPTATWNMNKKEVFNKIYSFKQRCYNVIEIFEAQTVFERTKETGLIGGPMGTVYEEDRRYVESLFHECLKEITIDLDVVFDVTKFIWRRKIMQFRYVILQLENMVVNLIHDIFKNVRNVEEGVEALYALQQFKGRNHFREILREKWIQVWELFNDDIKHCYTTTIMSSKEEISDNECLTSLSQYLKYQYSIMKNASVWLEECGAEKYALQQYEYVLDVIDKRRKMCSIYSGDGTQ